LGGIGFGEREGEKSGWGDIEEQNEYVSRYKSGDIFWAGPRITRLKGLKAV